LGHLSQRISDLHAAGYVHRDLKPGNIMWQPSTYTWVLIDFGLAARIGESAPVGCTPGYAAPETARAFLKGDRRILADDKADSWALGIIAFELLIGRSAFGMFQGVNDVRCCWFGDLGSHIVGPSCLGDAQAALYCAVGRFDRTRSSCFASVWGATVVWHGLISLTASPAT
jgi:serine/threonine protein kinase